MFLILEIANKLGVLKTFCHLQHGDFYCLSLTEKSMSFRYQCVKINSVACELPWSICAVQLRKCRELSGEGSLSAQPGTAQQGDRQLEIRSLGSVLCCDH